MSGFFTYNTSPSGFNSQTIPGPLFPDFSSESNMSKIMLRAKQVNGPDYWPTMCDVFAHDMETLPKNRFKIWASVLTVPFISTNRFLPYIQMVTDQIVKSPLVAEAVKEPMVGCTPTDFQNFLSLFADFPTTMNRVQHMGHLIICNYTPEQLSEMDTIVEIGGGIGDMTDIIYKLGFKGKYIIYDFKEVGAIQKYYHDELGLKNVVHTNNIDDLQTADLCIATWSLTEMPIDLRQKIMKKIKHTKNWLIAYSNKIFELDNDKYIKDEFVPLFKDYVIDFIDIPFMPWDGGSKYLTVKKIVDGLD
jgi:hypothetical protein